MSHAPLTVSVALWLPLAVALGGCEVITGWAAQVSGSEAGGPETGAVAAENSGNVYYQYVDESGSVRFVQSKAEIPSQYRAAAGRIEVETRRPTPPAAPAPSTRRNVWKEAAEAPWQGGRQNRDEVVMYTAPWCGVCRRAEAFLDRRGVRYTAKDIEADDAYKRELVKKTGRSAVPVIEVGRERMIGFDQRRLESLL